MKKWFYKFILYSVYNRKSIPKTWCGKWIDGTGRQLIIESYKHNFYLISVIDSSGEFYKINLFDEKQKNTDKLLASFIKDSYGNPILQVEAGVNEIGPTYNLLFLTKNNNGFVLARNNNMLNDIIIRPTIGIGLYGDDEDDIGVPWAMPLKDYIKNTN